MKDRVVVIAFSLDPSTLYFIQMLPNAPLVPPPESYAGLKNRSSSSRFWVRASFSPSLRAGGREQKRTLAVSKLRHNMLKNHLTELHIASLQSPSTTMATPKPVEEPPATEEKQPPQPLTEIDKPHSNDVLCGRGVTTNKWAGNEQFRSLVGLNKVSAHL